MEKIEGTLVTGHLARIFESYRRIYAAHMIVKKEYFEHFTTEAIIYARLEWSKFIRDGFSEKDRLIYLYEKCFEYDSPNVIIPKINVTIDDYYGIKMEITHYPTEVVKEKEDDGLPF